MQSKKRIAILILAAGGSNRLGEAKQLLPLAGSTLLNRTIREAQGSNAAQVLAVIGARHKEIASSMEGTQVAVVYNENWEKGMGSSLKAGILALREFDAVIIAVCDQPFISADIFNQLINEWETGHHSIVASSYEGTIGVPALFDTSEFPGLLKVSDESGAKSILFQKPVSTIPFEQGNVDIDTRTDWEDYLRSG